MPEPTKPKKDPPDTDAADRISDTLAADPVARTKPRKRATFILDDDDFEDLFNDVPV